MSIDGIDYKKIINNIQSLYEKYQNIYNLDNNKQKDINFDHKTFTKVSEKFKNKKFVLGNKIKKEFNFKSLAELFKENG